MASPLEKMKKQIAAGFKGKLKKGIVRQTPSSTLDDYGDAIPGDPIDATFEGIRESFDASWMKTALIPDTDVSVMVILGTVKPATVVPEQDNLVFIESKWHKVRRVLSIDPAGASMNLQVYEVPVPV